MTAVEVFEKIGLRWVCVVRFVTKRGRCGLGGGGVWPKGHQNSARGNDGLG